MKALVEALRVEISLLKSGRKSNTSSTPSSQDYTRSNVSNSREKSTRNSGGQKGHKGSSLKMSTTPDQTINYVPDFCGECGSCFEGAEAELIKRRQEIVIPPIVPQYIEHRSYQCNCLNCGNVTIGEIPAHLTANIQYGKNIQALITYMSVYQLLPAKRLKQFLSDVANIPMSEGTIFNILSSMSAKAQPAYEQIKSRLQQSKCVGGDETGARVNGGKAWFWIFQNNALTYIKAACTRSYQVILETFSDGFPMSVYVSDSLPTQLKVESLAKQLCLPHLMRELKNFEEVFSSKWATQMKTLFKEAIDYKKKKHEFEYSIKDIKTEEFEDKLTLLLKIDSSNKHAKEKAFINRLIKRRNAIFTFLYYKEVPPDNNGSERGIRNIKVKMKISNQFKSYEFAQHFAVIRSVIDTTIKNGQNVFKALSVLAEQTVNTPAE